MATKSTKKSSPQLIKTKPPDCKQKTTAPLQHGDETDFLTVLYDDQLKKCSVEIEDLKKQIERLSNENVSLKTELQQFKDNELQRTNQGEGQKTAKFAKKFSELYDIFWKNAFKEQIDKEGKSEEEGISFLLAIIKEANEYASKDVIEIQKIMSAFKLPPLPNEEKLPPKMVHVFKDAAKNMYNNFKEPLAHVSVEKFLQSQKKSGKTFGKATTVYAGTCAVFCLFMYFEDPPVYLDVDIPGGEFDTEKYRPYKNTGGEYKYQVWPCLYLHKGGPILGKGIAEGK